VEEAVAAAWITWYRQALDSVTRLPAGGATPALLDRIRRAKESVDHRAAHSFPAVLVPPGGQTSEHRPKGQPRPVVY
jgi:hypothetical protein